MDQALQGILERCDQVLLQAVQGRELAPEATRLRTLALWAAIHGVGHFRKRDRILPRELHSQQVARVLIDGLLVGWGAA